MLLRFLPVLYLLFIVVSVTASEEEQGFELLFKSSPNEYQDVEVNFGGKVPSWLQGTLLRTGPAMFEVSGDVVSSATNDLDGFSKLAKWEFTGNNKALFSTKFIQSTYYQESLATKKLVSNVFYAPPNTTLTMEEKKRARVVGRDNFNINVYNFPNPTSQEIEYAVLGDSRAVYKISLEDLSTDGKVTYELEGGTASTADMDSTIRQLATPHPLPEPNTVSNRVNLLLTAAVKPGEKNVLQVVRIKSLGKSEVIASWEIPYIPFLHSFSVTNTKVVIVMDPQSQNISCQINNDAVCFKWQADLETCDVYVVDLKTGDVQTLQIPQTFAIHHVNAYDLNDEELVVDLATQIDRTVFLKLSLKHVRDPKLRGYVETRAHLKRLRVNLKSNTASLTSLNTSSLPQSIIASTLDYPAINEAYRSKPYCYVYGIVEKTDGQYLGKQGIAKKDVCNSDGTNDLVFAMEGWYPSEPWFVASPGATEEDDGILLVTSTSGKDQLTSLFILNATDMSVIDMGKGPNLIPMSQHGRFFSSNGGSGTCCGCLVYLVLLITFFKLRYVIIID